MLIFFIFIIFRAIDRMHKTGKDSDAILDALNHDSSICCQSTSRRRRKTLHSDSDSDSKSQSKRIKKKQPPKKDAEETTKPHNKPIPSPSPNIPQNTSTTFGPKAKNVGGVSLPSETIIKTITVPKSRPSLAAQPTQSKIQLPAQSKKRQTLPVSNPTVSTVPFGNIGLEFGEIPSENTNETNDAADLFEYLSSRALGTEEVPQNEPISNAQPTVVNANSVSNIRISNVQSCANGGTKVTQPNKTDQIIQARRKHLQQQLLQRQRQQQQQAQKQLQQESAQSRTVRVMSTGNNEPLYHYINGYQIDLNSAARQNLIRLPDGKVIHVRKQPPNGKQTAPRSIPPAQQQQQQQSASLLRNGMATHAQQQQSVIVQPVITPQPHLVQPQINHAAHPQMQLPLNQPTQILQPRKYELTPVGNARTQLERQIFNGIEICRHIESKFRILMNSNAYKTVQKFDDVKELHIHLSYLLTFTLGRFRTLQEKCMEDMNKLGFQDAVNSLKKGNVIQKYSKNENKDELEIVEPQTDTINLDDSDDEDGIVSQAQNKTLNAGNHSQSIESNKTNKHDTETENEIENMECNVGANVTVTENCTERRENDENVIESSFDNFDCEADILALLRPDVMLDDNLDLELPTPPPLSPVENEPISNDPKLNSKAQIVLHRIDESHPELLRMSQCSKDLNQISIIENIDGSKNEKNSSTEVVIESSLMDRLEDISNELLHEAQTAMIKEKQKDKPNDQGESNKVNLEDQQAKYLSVSDPKKTESLSISDSTGAKISDKSDRTEEYRKDTCESSVIVISLDSTNEEIEEDNIPNSDENDVELAIVDKDQPNANENVKESSCENEDQSNCNENIEPMSENVNINPEKIRESTSEKIITESSKETTSKAETEVGIQNTNVQNENDEQLDTRNEDNDTSTMDVEENISLFQDKEDKSDSNEMKIDDIDSKTENDAIITVIEESKEITNNNLDHQTANTSNDEVAGGKGTNNENTYDIEMEDISSPENFD